MYAVYLRLPDQSISAKTNTTESALAFAAFSKLVERSDLDGTKILAVVNYGGKALAHHRFECLPGSTDYWRGRVHELQRQAPIEALGLQDIGQYVTVYLDAAAIARANAWGSGDVGEGIQVALRALRR